MEPIIFEMSKLKAWAISGLCGLVTFAGIWLILNWTEVPLVGLLALYGLVGLFGYGLIRWLWFILSGKLRIIISDEGVYDYRICNRTIPWKAIDNIAYTGKRGVVVLDLNNNWNPEYFPVKVIRGLQNGRIALNHKGMDTSAKTLFNDAQSSFKRYCVQNNHL